MRKQFEKSAETEKLISVFKDMKVNERISYAQISALVGFEVTSSNSSSARMIAERDMKVFIYAIPKFGLARGTGSDMVGSGFGMFRSVHNKMRRCSSRMLNAISENLDERDHRTATEMFSRANIIADTSSVSRAKSNREKVSAGNKAEPVNIHKALLGAKR